MQESVEKSVRVHNGVDVDGSKSGSSSSATPKLFTGFGRKDQLSWKIAALSDCKVGLVRKMVNELDHHIEDGGVRWRRGESRQPHELMWLAPLACLLLLSS